MKSISYKQCRVFEFSEGYTLECGFTWTAIAYDAIHGIIRIEQHLITRGCPIVKLNFFKGTHEEFLKKGRAYPL